MWFYTILYNPVLYTLKFSKQILHKCSLRSAASLFVTHLLWGRWLGENESVGDRSGLREMLQEVTGGLEGGGTVSHRKGPGVSTQSYKINTPATSTMRSNERTLRCQSVSTPQHWLLKFWLLRQYLH